MKYYSIKDNKINGFYDIDMHLSLLFDDSKLREGFYEITDEQYQELLKKQSQGYSLCCNVDGTVSPKKLTIGEYWNGLRVIIDEQLIFESEKEKARQQRNKEFEALDLYDKAVLRGDIEEALEMKSERDKFRSAWLSLPNSYTDISEEIESLYPQMPEFIKYFV